ncbi:MAG: tripartite tricarboxylate transporter TctB family protein [Oscillospiraceae bacterium]|nr:tripartite tricarboxylate transporter TctB family protein [Oscillospiraceae bacterium]
MPDNKSNDTTEYGDAGHAAERGFALALLLLGAAAFGMSLELWHSTPPPRASSAAALPLIVTALWTLAALLNLVGIFRSAWGGGSAHFIDALRFAIPPRLALTLLAVAAYCALLLLGVSFYLATPLFLFGTMCFLCRGDYVKNLIRTAVVTGFIVLVFRVLFGVVF